MPTEARQPIPDQRCPTGVTGLDDILGGGLPCSCFHQGDLGAGSRGS